MLRALLALEEGSLVLSPQAAEGVTYARKIDKGETRIDWKRPAAEVHNHIRGLSPFPGAWCQMPVGGRTERVKILRSTLTRGNGLPGEVLDDSLTIACGEGAVRLEELQRAGGKALRADDFLRGGKIEEGMMIS
jgi:methionyl-tRNA formyltransferase